MNATKRKFNSLVQGIGGKSTTDVAFEKASENTAPDSSGPDTTMQATGVLPTTPTKTKTSTRDTGAHSPTPAPAATPAATLTAANTTLMPSSANILSKRRRVTEALASTLGPSKTTTAPSRFANNAILQKYGSSPIIATVGKIEKPTPASRYCPGDRDELIRRLGTFQELTEWTPKPDRINEIEWAKRGWLCQGRERVRCALCNKELVVKLSSDKKPDEDSTTTFGGSQVEEAMVTRFAELLVDAHQEDCLWKKRGCDESLLRLHITSPQTTLESLRQRYDDLASRPAFLPYMFNLRLPASLDIQAAKSHLPTSFFTAPAPPSSLAATSKEGPNDVALVLAMTGWQGLTNPRIGPVPNSASCATCLRKLGLWLFKSQEMDEVTGQVLVAAPMDHLDPVREHRFFCPWRNPDAQRNAGSKSAESKAGWEVLLQTLKNNAYLRSQAERSNQKASNWTPRRTGTILHRATASVPSTPVRAPAGAATTPTAETPVDQGNLTMLGPGMGDDDDDEDPAARDAKDKERWARLRRVKTLFDTKGAKKLRRALSRPGTAGSHGSGGQSPRPVTAGAAQPATSTSSAAEAT